MASTSRSKESSSNGTRRRAANGRFTSRPRQRSANDEADSTRYEGDDLALVPRSAGAQVEHIAILSLALVSGLLGLALHVFWFVSIVLMAVLLGLIASTVRRRPGSGVVSEVVAEAKSVAADIGSAGSTGSQAGNSQAEKE
jgi:hypothetical protein